jgi:hypothetical protein
VLRSHARNTLASNPVWGAPATFARVPH